MSKSLAVVVGAGPGLGGSVAAKFAREGFRVALLNRSEKSARPTLERIASEGGEAFFVACDATKSEAVSAAFADLKNAEVLVYNASAGFPRKPLLETTSEDVRQSFDVNTMGLLFCAQQVLPAMVERASGTILVTSATAAFRGGAGSGAFVMAKFAQRGLAQTLAKEHAKHGVHVVNVRIDCGLDTPGLRDKIGDDAKMQYFGDTDQIAETYYFLHQQTALKRGWTNEIDIRPHTENWTY